jgi:alkylhydroperoxidase family enzyme
MDIGSAVGRELGITDTQLTQLGRYRVSDAFSEQERAVLDLAVAMTSDPVDVPSSLLDRLRGFFDEGQLVELAAAIAWENYRARFNRVFGVRPVGFSAGAACVLPAHPTAPD